MVNETRVKRGKRNGDPPNDLLPPLSLHVLDDLPLDALDLREQRVELVRRLHLSGIGRSLGVEGTELHAGRREVVVDDATGGGLGGSNPGDAGEEGVGRECGFEGCGRPGSAKKKMTGKGGGEGRRGRRDVSWGQRRGEKRRGKTHGLRLRHLVRETEDGCSLSRRIRVSNEAESGRPGRSRR